MNAADVFLPSKLTISADVGAALSELTASQTAAETRLQSLESRVDTLAAAPAVDPRSDARLAQLEARVETLAAAPVAGPPSDARLAELETRVEEVAGATARVADLEARVAALTTTTAQDDADDLQALQTRQSIVQTILAQKSALETLRRQVAQLLAAP